MHQFEMPQADMGPNNGPKGPSADMHSLDILDLIRRKFWFMVFFTLIGLSLGVLYYFKAPKIYESTAKVFVDEKVAPTQNTTDADTFITESSVEKYMEIIRSARILNPAIEAGQFDDLETFSETKDILYALARSDDHLRVGSADAKGLSSAIQLKFLGKTKEECQPILDSIVKSFETYIVDSTNTVGGQNIDTLQATQAEYETRLAEIDGQLEELSKKPHLRLRDAAGNYLDPHQIQQQNLMDDLHLVRREKTKLRAKLDTVKNAQVSGADAESMLMDVLADMSESAFGAYVATHRQYVELKVQEQSLRSEYASEHPELLKIRSQIVMVDKIRMQELNALRGGKRGEGNPQSEADFVQIFMDFMNGKINILESEEKSILESITAEQTASAAIAQDVTSFSELKRERDRLENRFNENFDRISEMKALKEVNWREMTILDPPSNPEQASPSLPISLGGGFMLGALLGLLFAGLKELAEKTFRSSDDVAALLGTRVIGHINQFTKPRRAKGTKHPSVAPEVIALHQPSSQSAEAYRAVRTSIFFRTQKTNAKVIQVTSPTPGDGKSTTISNLASSISQTGRRVLLIDGDFRKPVQHKLFGLTNDFGITSVIFGEMEWEDAIQEVVPGALSVLTCGPIPHNPAELLTSDYFPELIEDLSEEFDFVLIDTPPLLAVTDPSIVSSHVDLIYMVMRIRNGVRTNAQRAKEILNSMGVDLSGIVINGLRRKDQKSYNYGGRGGYGYGGYGAYGGPTAGSNGKQIRAGRRSGPTNQDPVRGPEMRSRR